MAPSDDAGPAALEQRVAMPHETLHGLPPTMSTQSLDCFPRPAGNEIQGDDDGDNIRVYVRVRPPTERELTIPVAAQQPILTVDPETHSVHLRGEQARSFTFDGVLEEFARQEDAFDLVGRGIGTKCLEGYNGSVYVYGQTGVGKTYTMFGPVTSVESMLLDERRGLTCRILGNVFSEMDRRRGTSSGISYACRCSFLEIYNERITDLLDVSNSHLQVREGARQGVYVERLSAPIVTTLTEAFSVLYKGIQQRHIGSTHMNERSSRSHAVFTLSVEVAQTRSGVTSTRVARLSLVDLAGSERQPGVLDTPYGLNAAFQSSRVKEASAINKSLSALTNVIMSLSREERSRRRSSVGSSAQENASARRPYVNYRDSKLTFLLRDSLGGNSKTVIVANVSPSTLCYAETLSTLKFAARAKHIRCAAVRNEEFSGTVESLTQEVRSLRLQLSNLGGSCIQARFPRISYIAQGSSSSLGADGGKSSFGVGTNARSDVSLVPEGQEELYSSQRVLRLEVMLAAALERERRADRSRHQLQKLAVFLEDLDFRKTHNLKRLYDEYAAIAEHIDVASNCESEANELTTKLRSFGELLGCLSGEVDPTFAGILPSHSDDPSVQGYDVESADHAGSVQAVGGIAQNRLGHKRGVNQSLQRNLADRPVTLCSQDSASESKELHVAEGSLANASSESASTALLGGLVDESSFLRKENERLRQQLRQHPEMNRLVSENLALRAQLKAFEPPVEAQSWSKKRSAWTDGHISSDDEFIDGDTCRDSVEGQRDSAARVTDESLSERVTTEMLLRHTNMDEENNLRTWVYFQKMAKEVEELLRAKDTLADALSVAQRASSNADSVGIQLSQQIEGTETQHRAPHLLRCSVEPQTFEEFSQTTQDAVQLAQAILDSTTFPEDIDDSLKSARLASSPSEFASDWAQLQQALHRIKHLNGTLELVNGAYTDAYDQFQRLREDYESRIEECQFFELQCSRLDMCCHELTARLHGVASPVRCGIGSFSATGLSNAQSHSLQNRSFSLSSLKDVNFWESRFQELSELTGISDTDSAQRNGNGSKGQAQATREEVGWVQRSAPPQTTRDPRDRAGSIADLHRDRHTSSFRGLPANTGSAVLHGTCLAPRSYVGQAVPFSSTLPASAGVVKRVASAPILPSLASVSGLGRLLPHHLSNSVPYVIDSAKPSQPFAASDDSAAAHTILHRSATPLTSSQTMLTSGAGSGGGGTLIHPRHISSVGMSQINGAQVAPVSAVPVQLAPAQASAALYTDGCRAVEHPAASARNQTPDRADIVGGATVAAAAAVPNSARGVVGRGGGSVAGTVTSSAGLRQVASARTTPQPRPQGGAVPRLRLGRSPAGSAPVVRGATPLSYSHHRPVT